MPYEFVIYPDPLSSRVTLTPDGQPSAQGVAYTAPDGRQGQVCYVADNAESGHGAALLVEANDHIPLNVRGFLMLSTDPATLAGVARLQVDDVHLSLVPTPPPPDPEPEPGPATDPLGIINEVYASGKFNLATHNGCGLFTEECCRQLHERVSPWYGHIKKEAGQNQFNGHAVDAVQLLTGAGSGIFDIIQDSVSPSAKPAYNRVGDANPELWYYPPAGQVMSAKALVEGLIHLLKQA